MLTLFHSPQSRSSAILALVEEMGIADRIALRSVTIPRADGSGQRDPANPHPEGKVPVLVHDGHVITERGAIILHLCGLFPDTGLSPAPETPQWGVFAAWLTWYHAVVEPVLVCEAAQLAHPYLTSTFRGPAEIAARLRAALDKGPWLLGDTYSAADLLVHSPFAWFPGFTPDDAVIRDWVDRCKARPARLRALQREAA